MTTDTEEVIAHYKPKIDTLQAAIDVLNSLQFDGNQHRYDKEIAGLFKAIEEIQYAVFKHARVI